jgi:DNA-binding NarL/FixJ family response regulator
MKITDDKDAEILKHKAEGKANKEVAPLDIEIAKHRGEGKPVKAIASLVNIPEHTVKYRIAKMLKVFDCRNSVELLLKLAKMNLI